MYFKVGMRPEFVTNKDRLQPKPPTEANEKSKKPDTKPKRAKIPVPPVSPSLDRQKELKELSEIVTREYSRK